MFNAYIEMRALKVAAAMSVLAANDDVVPIICTLQFTASADTLNIVATDRYRVGNLSLTGTKVAYSDGEDAGEIVINARAFKDAVAMIARAKSFGATLQVDGDRWTLTAHHNGSETIAPSGSGIAGNYPPVARLFPESNLYPVATVSVNPAFVGDLAKIANAAGVKNAAFKFAATADRALERKDAPLVTSLQFDEGTFTYLLQPSVIAGETLRVLDNDLELPVIGKGESRANETAGKLRTLESAHEQMTANYVAACERADNLAAQVAALESAQDAPVADESAQVAADEIAALRELLESRDNALTAAQREVAAESERANAAEAALGVQSARVAALESAQDAHVAPVALSWDAIAQALAEIATLTPKMVERIASEYLKTHDADASVIKGCGTTAGKRSQAVLDALAKIA